MKTLLVLLGILCIHSYSLALIYSPPSPESNQSLSDPSRDIAAYTAISDTDIVRVDSVSIPSPYSLTAYETARLGLGCNLEPDGVELPLEPVVNVSVEAGDITHPICLLDRTGFPGRPIALLTAGM